MLKKHKSKIIIISVLTIGLILILFGTFKSTEKDKEVTNDFSCELYTSELEEKIEQFLLNVDGIRNVNVIVTLDTSGEQVYAQNEGSYDFLTITSNGKQSPVYIGEIYPNVRGVAIACTNGSQDEVKNKITRLISAYLGISSNRIEIVSFG
ncbi:MAG: hypothetical protein IJ437_03080 [Clostridia bacterium]|nr:hypothetical protein [Clostridia bacterium]